MPQLTIDVTPSLLDGGLVPSTKRVRNFIERGIFHEERVFLRAIEVEDAPALELTANRETLRLHGLERERFSPGDRIVVRVSEDASTYDHQDGSAVLVLQILDRGDHYTRRRIMELIPLGDARVRTPLDRKRWASARDAILNTLVIQELAGVAAIEAGIVGLGRLETFNRGRGILLVGGDDQLVDAAELVATTRRPRAEVARALESVMSSSSELYGMPIRRGALTNDLSSVARCEPVDLESLIEFRQDRSE